MNDYESVIELHELKEHHVIELNPTDYFKSVDYHKWMIMKV